MLKEKSKNILFGIVVFIILMQGTIFLAQGHSPSSMTLEYTIATEELAVTISHSVSDVNTHYIELVEIWKNEILELSQDYTSQPDTTFTYTYQINVTKGDELEVKATCNLGGSLTRNIIPIPDTTSPTTTDTANSYQIGLIGLSLIVITIIPMIIKRKNKK